MPDLTLKRMDAAIRQELRKRGCEFEPGTNSGPVNNIFFEDLRAVALLAMNLAAEVEPVMAYRPDDYLFHYGQREGRDRTRAAIKKRAAWLRKEAKAND